MKRTDENKRQWITHLSGEIRRWWAFRSDESIHCRRHARHVIRRAINKIRRVQCE